MAQSKIHLSDLGESETWIRKPMDAIFIPNLNSSHKHARGWLQWRAMGQKISKEDDSQYEVGVIVEMMSGKAGGCSPLLLCLSSTVSLMTLISALPGLVDVRLIQCTAVGLLLWRVSQ